MRGGPNAGAVLISLVVSVGFVAVTVLWLLRPVKEESEGLSILMGALAANFTSVVGFWIGSSLSAKSKDETIKEIATTTAATAAVAANTAAVVAGADVEAQRRGAG